MRQITTLLLMLSLPTYAATISPSEWSPGIVKHNERYELDVAVEPADAAIDVFIPCNCLSYQRLAPGRFRVVLFTQGILGARDYPLQFIVKEAARTSILRLPVRFDVRSRRPAESGTPDLALRYRKEDADLLHRFGEVSDALRTTEEVVPADRTELVERDRTTSGVGAIRRRLLDLGGGGDPHAAEAPAGPADAGARKIVFFYTPDCGTCRWLKTRFFPPLQEAHGFSVDARSVSEEANLRMLWGLLRKHGRKEADSIVVLAGDRLFVGVEEIRELLPRYLDDGGSLASAVGADPSTALGTNSPSHMGPDLADAFAGISVAAVAFAGLVDGINPCAFVTAVFLISFLAAGGRRRGAALAVGGVYAAAVFVTYFALGLGLFTIARSALIGDGLRYAAGAFVIVLALVSLRDAAAYAATGSAGSVALQLPAAVKTRIHALIRDRLTTGGLLAGAAAAGVGVTLLEAVCTGQVYLPTIVAMTRTADTAARATGLLAVYNLAFVLPLVGVLLAAVAGVSSKRLADISRRNVVAAKAAMAVLFLGLAAYLFT